MMKLTPYNCITHIETVRDALSKLNDEEREIIDRLYFNGETIRSVAETKKYLIQLS